MSYIRTIDPADANDRLAALYRRFGNPDGTVDNVIKVHLIRPETLESHVEMYTQCMHKPGPLPRYERELIGVVVSAANGCDYCRVHHAAGMKRLIEPSRRHVADEAREGDLSSLNVRESAIAIYAKKLATTPALMQASDVESLRDAQLTDEEILDVAHITGYYAYVNRIVLGLGVAIEHDVTPGQHPGESAER